MSDQKNTHPNAELVIDQDRRRAELWDTVEGKPTFIGFVGYAETTSENQPVWRLMHTIVNERFGRQGYARALVTLLLEKLAAEGQIFTSECTYIDHFLTRFPQYRKHQALTA